MENGKQHTQCDPYKKFPIGKLPVGWEPQDHLPYQRADNCPEPIIENGYYHMDLRVKWRFTHDKGREDKILQR